MYKLKHWGRVTRICVSKITIIGPDNGLLPSHYLNQCWNIVDWTLGNKLKWNLNQNSNIFIQANAFENVIWKMVAYLCCPQCVKHRNGIERCSNANFSSLVAQKVSLWYLVVLLMITQLAPWQLFNSLWPSNARWRQRSGLTLAQVMACCLTAPSNYLNQSWLIISKV